MLYLHVLLSRCPRERSGGTTGPLAQSAAGGGDDAEGGEGRALRKDLCDFATVGELRLEDPLSAVRGALEEVDAHAALRSLVLGNDALHIEPRRHWDASEGVFRKQSNLSVG